MRCGHVDQPKFGAELPGDHQQRNQKLLGWSQVVGGSEGNKCLQGPQEHSAPSFSLPTLAPGAGCLQRSSTSTTETGNRLKSSTRLTSATIWSNWPVTPCLSGYQCPSQPGVSQGQAQTWPMCRERWSQIWPLYPNTKLILKDRVFGEVEKNSFIVLPGKGGHSGLMPSKLCVPTQGSLARSFMAKVQGGFADKIRVCAGPAPL